VRSSGGTKPVANRRQLIYRLVLWNIDLTLLDVAKVTRAAYAEAFAAVTGRPLVRLPQMAGYTEPEIFFDALGRNGVSLRADGDSERLVLPFGAEFASRLAARAAWEISSACCTASCLPVSALANAVCRLKACSRTTSGTPRLSLARRAWSREELALWR